MDMAHRFRRNASVQKKWRAFLLLVVAGVVSVLFVSCSVKEFNDAFRSDDGPLLPSHSTTRRGGNNKNVTIIEKLPSVACFFMVDQKSVENAVAVRYSNWAKRCSHFVIFSNGVAPHGGEAALDDNTGEKSNVPRMTWLILLCSKSLTMFQSL